MCERPRVHESKNPISGKRHLNHFCFKTRMEKKEKRSDKKRNADGSGLRLQHSVISSAVSVHCSDNSCLERSGQHGGLPSPVSPP